MTRTGHQRVIGVLLVFCAAASACKTEAVREPSQDSVAVVRSSPERLTSDQALADRLLSTRCDTEEFRYLADQVVAIVREPDSVTVSGNVDPAETLMPAEELNNSQRHDCQRLIKTSQGSSLVYGPLVALFVTDTMVEKQVPPDGHVVATIINYDSVAYEPLNIPARRGKSCLWIRHDTSAAQPWTAQVLAVADTVSCTRADPGHGPVLEVVALATSDGDDDGATVDYPSTGRWIWDEDNKLQGIGIRCGNFWCEIGQPQFGFTNAIVVEDSIPGWFDRQRLALPTGNPGVLRVSPIIGIIRPGEDNRFAEDRSLSDPGSDMHVATLDFLTSVAGPAATHYRGRFALGTGPMTGIKVFMRREDRDLSPGSLYGFQHRGMGDDWEEVRRCNVPHSGSGTVRWAWIEPDTTGVGDEGFWVPCDAGCCMVRGFKR